MLTANLLWVGLEEQDILGHRSRERMVARIPTVHLPIEAQQRELDDPKEIKARRINHQLALGLEHLSAVEADLAQDLARIEPLVSGEENQIALLDAQLLGEGRLLRLVEELHDRRLPLPFSTLMNARPLAPKLLAYSVMVSI